MFSYIHGIRWRDVANEPTFAELWPRIEAVTTGAEFFAAHNAPFDRRVLDACCATAGIRRKPIPFRCTVAAARRAFRCPTCARGSASS